MTVNAEIVYYAVMPTVETASLTFCMYLYRIVLGDNMVSACMMYDLMTVSATSLVVYLFSVMSNGPLRSAASYQC